MLTRKQHELLIYIHDRLTESGISPSFEEMKDALDLKSKSGVHRLISALEERGFIQRLANRARALEVIKMPERSGETRAVSTTNVVHIAPKPGGPKAIRQPANDVMDIPLHGRIAAGMPIEALEGQSTLSVPAALLGSESLLPMLAQLRDKTGETVTLTMASDLHMQVLHALIGTHPIALQVEEGVAFPMMGSAIGTMYLAGLDRASVRQLYDRWAAQGQGQAQSGARRSFLELTTQIEHAVSEGYTTAYDAVLTDTGAVAMPLKMDVTGETLIVAVAGLSARIERKEEAIIKTMTRLIGTVA